MKKTIAVLIIVALITPVTAFAQSETASAQESYNRGVLAADLEHSAVGWGVGGFLAGGIFSWLGTGAVVLIASGSNPSPRFVPEPYESTSYRVGYRDEGRRKNRRAAAIPGVIMSVLWTVVVLSAN